MTGWDDDLMETCIQKVMLTSSILAGLCCFAGEEPAAAAMPDPLGWPAPVAENRPGAIWWWMGSGVDRENLTWNLEQLREAGMGGVTIVPIYGAKGYEDRFIEYLSPEWLQMMDHSVREAERLGLWVDMSTVTGWPFGGPHVTEENADATVAYEDGELSYRFSGMKVKRAAPGGGGRVLNPYSARALTEYLTRFDEAFADGDYRLPRAQYHDSFEYSGNWCRELPDAFRKRRGYDLLDHLPTLFGEGDKELVARVKADYRETLSDLHLEYLETWHAWATGKDCITRNQAHGAPANLLDLYAASAIPETETFGASEFEIPGIRRDADNVDRRNRPQPFINRMASSAAHVAGRPLASAEACTWIRNHFRTALSQVKPEIDQLFLSGINHVIFHGTCYSPRDADWPGWLFYASLVYNPRNAIWHDAPHLNAYIARCQSILQAGQPDNDVALYWPVHDIWHAADGMQQKLTVHHPEWLMRSACGKASVALKTHGFGFDFISDRQLLADLAAPYRAVVVPETRHMPLATLKELLRLSDQGKPVVFLDGLPSGVPGFHEHEARAAALKEMLKGREDLVVTTRDLREQLGGTDVAREPMVDAGLDFIRRTHEEGRHYFIANMSAEAVGGWIPLGVPFQSAVIMDPQSARTGAAFRRNGSEIYLQLLPGETRMVRTFKDRDVEGSNWPILHGTGDAPVVIEGTWDVTFVEGAPELPGAFRTKSLKSWTELGDEECLRFAGTGRYAIEFDLPSTGADDWVLDLGDVRESARVFINGEQAGALYSIPYRMPVGRFLRPGRNRLEIEVTNLSANRIRDLDTRGVVWRNFHDINFVNQNYKKFDASKWPLTPSGLLGPVRLAPARHGHEGTKKQERSEAN